MTNLGRYVIIYLQVWIFHACFFVILPFYLVRYMGKENEQLTEPSNETTPNAVEDLSTAAVAAGAASDAYNASSVAEQSGADAAGAAQHADIAAAAAEAAAINQAQIIGIVTEAARADAERARNQAESAATEAGQQAELAGTVAEYTISQVAMMLEEHNKRISALETRPTVVQENNGVSTINPQEVENSSREESMDGGEEQKSSSRRSHGRRRR